MPLTRVNSVSEMWVPFRGYNKDAEAEDAASSPRCDAIPSPEQSWGNFKELVSRTTLLSQSRAGLRDFPGAVPHPPYEIILLIRLTLKHY